MRSRQPAVDPAQASRWHAWSAARLHQPASAVRPTSSQPCPRPHLHPAAPRLLHQVLDLPLADAHLLQVLARKHNLRGGEAGARSEVRERGECHAAPRFRCDANSAGRTA
jgi:hypothetical protein